MVEKNSEFWEEERLVSVRLLPMQEKYFSAVLKMLEDPKTREMLGVVKLPRYESFKKDDVLNYIIFNQQDEIVGKVELFEISWRNRRAQLSVIIDPEYRGQGYANLGIRKILDIGFGDLGLHRIWLRVLEYNHSAIELYKKIGFKVEGRCRDQSFRRGKFWDQLQMSILAPDWLEIKVGEESRTAYFLGK